MMKTKFNLRIFSIDKNHYALRNKNNAEIINEIISNHKRGLHAQKTDLEVAQPNINNFVQGEFQFYTYCYNEPKTQNYWELFLPNELVDGQDFEIVEFSYVLFIIFKGEIYVVVSGSGYRVIQSFLKENFGIDLYQHFANPSEDIILKVESRGIAGNISQKNNTFNYDQRLSESLEYSEIPKKLKIIVREELRQSIFKKYNLKENKPIMEIGNYFSLRKKISFEELKELITDIAIIKSDKTKYTRLTLFSKVENPKLQDNLDEELKSKIVHDVVLHNTPQYLSELNDDIIEMVNPKKLEKFYECDCFKIKFKHKSHDKDLTINDRDKLYLKCTEYIFKSLDDINDKFDIKGKFYTLNVNGIINGIASTFGTFFSHIICEITYQERKYFRIDNQWYILDDRFLKKIKLDALNSYRDNHLEPLLLNKWETGWDEDRYNKSHQKKGYFVLDKVIRDNIELCDVLIKKEDKLYFVHVKNGFNTQMRNLYIQIILSAKRLWNDIYNNTGSSYLEKTLKAYNKNNPSKTIDIKEIVEGILNNKYQVVFVMAYRNTIKKGKSSSDRIKASNSNIAQYSLVQTVREMRNFSRFDIKVIDISEI